MGSDFRNIIKIDKIIRTKRKTISLQITDDAMLIVRAPFNVDDETILKVVNKHKNWIEQKKRIIEKREHKFFPKEFVNGEGFLYLGRIYKLKIIENQEIPVRFVNGFYLSKKALSNAKEVFIDWYKKMAKEKLSERVSRYSKLSGIEYREINITNAKKRLGSCSPNGNLNFSWRLIMAPLSVIDYVVVHELVHIKEKNHSKQFWNKVKILLPDYEKHKEWLKSNWHILKI